MHVVSHAEFDYVVKLLQVCIWNDTHSSAGRLASDACRTHWFYAHGILLIIPIFLFVNVFQVLQKIFCFFFFIFFGLGFFKLVC